MPLPSILRQAAEVVFLLHTLEDFCSLVFPEKTGQAFYHKYYWLLSLAKPETQRLQYRLLEIKKPSGAIRRISAPFPALKGVQRAVLSLLEEAEVSPHAAAYVKGRKMADHLSLHTGKELILKLDIQNFFGSIGFVPVFRAIDGALEESSLVGRHHLNAYDRVERDPYTYNRVLSFYFARFCTLDGALPQGAPTSPILSNLVFLPIDRQIGEYCRRRGIAYTRYSDDMTFSGSFDARAAVRFVERLLEENGFSINRGKTVVTRKGRRQTVTGAVVNEKVQTNEAYRRGIRQELHYIRRYGLADHLARAAGSRGKDRENGAYLARLLGRIGYVLSFTPDKQEFLNYRHEILSLMRERELEGKV